MQSLIKLDQNVFNWLNSFVGINPVLDLLVKFFAVYLIYFVPFVFLFFWFWHKTEKVQKFLLELFFVSVVSWQVIARAIGMIIDRPRPSTFLGTKEIFFHPPTYSFPSDHALFLACLTAYLYFSGYKKVANIALVATILVSLARVIAGLHWPGDVLAGWILGIILAFVFFKFNKYIIKYIVNPLYFIAKKIRLA
jgi:undecaprenyl-diphosphatase